MSVCDLIVKGKNLLPMDKTMAIIEDGLVAVSGNDIVAVGARNDLEKKYKAREVIDVGNSIVMPGLVNTHTHAAMAYFRGLADDLPLKEWLAEHIWPAETKYVNENFVKKSSELACLEMIKSGTTAFNDMYFFADITALTARQANLRVMLGEGIIDFKTPSCDTPSQALDKAISLLERYVNDKLIKIALTPHAIYTVNKKILIKVRDLAVRYNLPVHIHVSETKKEVDDCKKKHGLTPVAYLDNLGLLNKNTIAAHSVWLDEDDIAIYKKRGVKASHCPISNMKLASGIAPIAKMIKQDIIIGLGTDSAASNNTLDIFSEMRACALSQKAHNLDSTILPAREIVKMATINGARVLGLDKDIGSLEIGKKADIITINLDKPHLQPIHNLYSHLVHCVEAQDVDNVIINGQVVMKNRGVQTLDEERILKDVKKFNGFK